MRKKLEKTIFASFAIVAILAFAACSCCKSTTNSTQVSFHEARNYFLNTGKELNVDEIIEYVDMPTIYDTDKAVEEEKPAFVLRLADKIENLITNYSK